MPLLQESTPKRDILSARDRKETEEPTTLKNPLTSVAFPSFPNSAMFTPSQLLMASQLMAASGLGLSANPAFFHPGLLPLAWPANSPPSPPNCTDQISSSLKARKLNNNNVVSSTSAELPKRVIWKTEDELPLSSPTSSSSPPSSTDATKDVNRDKQFTCGVCNRSFGYKHVLQNHERTHTGEKPFECTECHKRFTRDHHLKTHMRLHTGERPYHCEHCDRQFVQVANLRRHLRVHTGERPYACKHCTAKFSDSNQLKAHLLIHTNEKPFDCEKCHSRFRRRHHLLHHKCGNIIKKEMTPESDEHEEDIRSRRMFHPPTTPLISLPLHLPEQTEPEDLSMSTGMHSHSSGESPLSRSPMSRSELSRSPMSRSPMSRSPSSREDLDLDDYEHHEPGPIFLHRRPEIHHP